MLKKIFLISLFLIISFAVDPSLIFAQTQNDWNKVVNLANSEIAVETIKRKTIFGKLTSANDNEIVVQIVDKTGLTGQTEIIKKSDVKKVWSAKLDFEKNRGKAAAIGAGIGAGVGVGLSLILLGATNGSDDTGGIIAVGAAVGGGAGALLGALARGTRHKKQGLIYKI